MLVASVLSIYYKDNEWACGDSYDTIEWYDKTIEKPTQEKINELYELFLINEMREKRNKLLFESDCKMSIDFPHKEGERELWIQYRIELRNLPEIWVNNISSFPEKPQ
jgi:hypothetical protein